MRHQRVVLRDLAQDPRKDLAGAAAEARLRRFRADLSRELTGRRHFVMVDPQLGGAAKRAVDIVLASFALLMSSPIIALLALLIWLQDRGSPFYGQARIGYAGRAFRCWKLRSMIKDSDARLEAHLAADPEAAEEWKATRKLRTDPRITALGRFIRRTSLDELPQFFNVLIGEMSIVGPRPVVHEELEYFGPSVRHYVRCRPGLSGLWQVSGRSDTSYARRVELDRTYVQTWSLWGDVAIMLKTPLAMVRGAY